MLFVHFLLDRMLFAVDYVEKFQHFLRLFDAATHGFPLSYTLKEILMFVILLYVPSYLFQIRLLLFLYLVR